MTITRPRRPKFLLTPHGVTDHDIAQTMLARRGAHPAPFNKSKRGALRRAERRHVILNKQQEINNAI